LDPFSCTTDYGEYCDSISTISELNWAPLLFAMISLVGGGLGITSGVLMNIKTKIASILAIVSSIICLIGGFIVFGMVGFVLLLISGILGLTRE